MQLFEVVQREVLKIVCWHLFVESWFIPNRRGMIPAFSLHVGPFSWV
jgi:hypothetical protein